MGSHVKGARLRAASQELDSEELRTRNLILY